MTPAWHLERVYGCKAMNYEIEAEYYAGQICASGGFTEERQLLDQIVLALRCEGRIKRLCLNQKAVVGEEYEDLIINGIFLLASELMADHLEISLEEALDRFIGASKQCEIAIRNRLRPEGSEAPPVECRPGFK